MARYLSKPKVPVINWGNSITRGLIFDAPLFEGAGLQSKENFNKSQGIFNGSVLPTWTKGNYGIGVNFDGVQANAGRIIYTSIPKQDNLTMITMEALVYLNGKGPSNEGRIFSKASTTRYGILHRDFTNTNALDFFAGWSGSNGQWDTPAGTFVPGNYYHVVATYNANSTSNVPVIYINGVSQPLSTFSNPSGSLNADASNFTVGNANSGTRTFDGKIFYCRFWNRLITDKEVKSLYANPWQIYTKSLNIKSKLTK